MAVALDADAVIGFLDRSDALHRSAAKLVGEAARDGPLVTSAVTYAEVMTGALLGHQGEELVRGFFRDLVAEVIATDAEIAEAAARIRVETALRMPDAIVLATAQGRSEVGALITGDERIARAAVAGVEIRLLEGG